MKKYQISAVVTVRKGSQRVKNKNLKKFYRKNLLIYKIEILKKIKQIDNIIINTDSQEAIEIAKKYNVAFHKRDPYYASSECRNSDFWKHIAQNHLVPANNVLLQDPLCPSQSRHHTQSRRL